MAIIIPFSDPNAHGSVADSVSFRRRGNKVIFQKKPHPVQPNSAQQLAQREAFKNATQDWYSYDAQSKLYFVDRGEQLGISARNLFIKAKLLNIMPSTTTLFLKEVQNAQITLTRGLASHSVAIMFEALTSALNFGDISDNENSYIFSNAHDPALKIAMTLEEDGGPAVTYLFRDSIYIQVKNSSDEIKELILRLPKNLVVGALKTFYISLDGSLFYDENFLHLAGTNNF